MTTTLRGARNRAGHDPHRRHEAPAGAREQPRRHLRSGREKLHFLNPVPIRLIYDRWIDKYCCAGTRCSPSLEARTGATGTMTAFPRRTIATYRRSGSMRAPTRSGPRSPTPPGRDRLRLRRLRVFFALRAGRRASATEDRAGRCATMEKRNELAAGRRVIMGADLPRRLVQTWRIADGRLQLAAEGFTRLTYEIEPVDGGFKQADRRAAISPPRRVSAPLVVTGELEGTGAGGSRNMGAQRPQDGARNTTTRSIASSARPARARPRRRARSSSPAG